MTDANTKNEVEMTHNAPAENQVSPETGKNAADATAEQHGTDDKFENKLQYWLSCIGFAVGFGNVWRFPHMCYSSGGAAFLVPYFFCFFFIAVPLFLIETAYGQLIDCRLHLRWGAIFRRLWGVKVLQVCICFGTLIYYITLMAWSFRFLFSCFQSELPWMLKTAADGTKVEDLWNDEFFNNEVMQKSQNINFQGGMVGPLVGCLVLSYFVTYFSAWKGIQSTGKMVYVTCLLPYVILTILLIKGLTLKGCGEGLNFLFLPNWDIVAKTDTWRKAATQILF
jgi:SNF family Na+-dependent transporter